MIFLGRRLKELRKKTKMTQQELGDKISVTKVSICCYEKGTRVPSLETLIDISNLFDVSLDYLVGNDRYIVSEQSSGYGMRVSNADILLLKELKKNNDLYAKLSNDPKRMIELIRNKIR